MADRVKDHCITTGPRRSLATDSFDVGFGLFVYLEQHRDLSSWVYQMGDRATICRPAGGGVLLES